MLNIIVFTLFCVNLQKAKYIWNYHEQTLKSNPLNITQLSSITKINNYINNIIH